MGKQRDSFPNSIRNELRSRKAVFGDVGDQFMEVAPRPATPCDVHSGTLFQPLFFPGGSENLFDLPLHLLVGNTGGFISERLFDSGAEPLLVSGFGFTYLFLKGGEGFLITLNQQLLSKPLSLIGRELAGFVKDSLGVGAHGKIVARIGL